METTKKPNDKAKETVADVEGLTDIDLEAIAEEFDVTNNKPMQYELNKDKIDKIFIVGIATDETRYRPTQGFSVELHQNFSKFYPVDEDSKLFVATMEKGEKLFAKLFQVDKEAEGRKYRLIGLEMRDKGGSKIDYTSNAKDRNGSRVKGFWFSKNDRLALKRMGYLNLVEKK
jgi:hypothetical protein